LRIGSLDATQQAAQQAANQQSIIDYYNLIELVGGI
jgi:hypothetical protein